MDDIAQKILPFIWFDNQAEDAVNLYTSAFENSRIARTARYGDSGPGPQGSVMTIEFTLAGQEFMALNGGPYYTLTPAISFFVECPTAEQLDRVWGKLSDGGKTLMPLDVYPFSKRFGWLQDRFGVSWQLNLAGLKTQIAPCIMFIGKYHGKADEAVQFYLSLFDDARLIQLERYASGEPGPEGTVKFAKFSLAGREFRAMDSGTNHSFKVTGAISFFVPCETQAEIDELWSALGSGGTPLQCGWIEDRFGVTWQIVPRILGEMLQDEDPQKAKRVMDAMLKMIKLDVAMLKHAYDLG